MHIDLLAKCSSLWDFPSTQMLSATISELLKKQILGILSLLWAWFCVQSPPNMSPPTVIDKAVVPGAHRIRCWSGNDSRAAVVPLRAGSSIEALV